MRPAVPWWSVLVLAALYAPLVPLHEAVFGGGVGALAAGGGVAVGLALAWVSHRRSWDPLLTCVSVAVAWLALGGVFAVRPTTLAGTLPTPETVRVLVLGTVTVWRDLLTLSPPAGEFTGPAVLPWMVGLVCGAVSGVVTVRARRPVLGTLPLFVMAGVGVAWGLGGLRPAPWPTALWTLAVLAWWGVSAQLRRVAAGQDLLVGRVGVDEDTLTASVRAGRSVNAVHLRRRLIGGAATLAAAGLVAVPLAPWAQQDRTRVVLRDLVEPPLDVREYPSPLASFRHYTTDLEDEPLVTVSHLPRGARVRLATMDTYDGTAFGLSDPTRSPQNRYVRTGPDLHNDADAVGTAVTVTVTTDHLEGPWLPSVADPQQVTFTGGPPEGLHVNRQAATLLGTGFTSGRARYRLRAVVPPELPDGRFAGADAAAPSGDPDRNVPDQVRELAYELTARESTALGRARAIERHLSRNGFYSNERTSASRSGHRADRLTRMLELEELIGDDEQYAALTALMLHEVGMEARVVMGLYPEETPPEGKPVVLRGSDVHAWVEVRFEGVGWAVLDPTPPRDQVPQTDVPKPRSVERPQVLQPPEPPKPPVELPPVDSDRPNTDGQDPLARIPWVAVLIGTGTVLLLVAPFLLILAVKARRRRLRRARPDPRHALAGAWEETVDRAADAGAAVAAGPTRQETARIIAPLITEPDHDRVPTLARVADAASFGPFPPDRAAVDAAWEEADDLGRQLAGTGLLTRARRRVSLRSLVRPRARRRRR